VKLFRCMTEEEYNTRHLRRKPLTAVEFIVITVAACLVGFWVL
jgi:hypothetical protein